jgi:hypothetical protein
MGRVILLTLFVLFALLSADALEIITEPDVRVAKISGSNGTFTIYGAVIGMGKTPNNGKDVVETNIGSGPTVFCSIMHSRDIGDTELCSVKYKEVPGWPEKMWVLIIQSNSNTLECGAQCFSIEF